MEPSGSQNNTLPSAHILLAKMSHMTNPIARKSGRGGGVQRISVGPHGSVCALLQCSSHASTENDACHTPQHSKML